MGLFDFFKSKKNSPSPETNKPEPKYFTFTETFRLSGFKEKIEDWKDCLEKNADFDLDYEDIKDLYNIGEKIYEYNALHSKIQVSIGDLQNDKIPVSFNDKQVGYIGKAKSSEFMRLYTTYHVKGIYPEMLMGTYKHVVKNESYNPEYDEPEDRKWVEFDSMDKPVAKIELVLQKEV